MIETTLDAARTTTIRTLNNALRRHGEGGRTVLTRRIAALPSDELATVLRAVANFGAFGERNDFLGKLSTNQSGLSVVVEIGWQGQGGTFNGPVAQGLPKPIHLFIGADNPVLCTREDCSVTKAKVIN